MGIFDLFGPPNVEKMLAKKDIEGLIKALRHKEANVRAKAAKALGNVGDMRAVEPLITALNDNDSRVEKATTEALLKIGSPAVEPLLITLRDTEKSVRKAAAKVLGNLRDARAVMPLINALNDKDWDVCKCAAKALESSGDQNALGNLIRYYLSIVLNNDDFEKREYATIKLAKIGMPAFEALTTILKDSRCDFARTEAAKAVGMIGDNRAVEPLIQILQKTPFEFLDLGGRLISKDDMCKEVAIALGKIGDHRAIKPLIEFFIGQGHLMRPEFHAALSEFGVAVVSPLIAIIKNNNKDWGLRRESVDVLLSIPWKPKDNYLQALFTFLREKWEEALALVEMDENLYNAIVELLHNALKHKDWETREEAAEALAVLKDARTIMPLINSLRKSSNWTVRLAVTEALCGLAGNE